MCQECKQEHQEANYDMDYNIQKYDDLKQVLLHDCSEKSSMKCYLFHDCIMLREPWLADQSQFK